MLFQHFKWDLTHQVQRPVLKMHILWCKTDICSCKLSAKVSLMLDNLFPAPSLCKLNHISVCFIQIKVIPGVLGCSVNFNIEVSMKMPRVSRLSFHFLWLLKSTKCNQEKKTCKKTQLVTAISDKIVEIQKLANEVFWNFLWLHLSLLASGL